jgi:hypothetical protein
VAAEVCCFPVSLRCALTPATLGMDFLAVGGADAGASSTTSEVRLHSRACDKREGFAPFTLAATVTSFETGPGFLADSNPE